MPVSAQTRTRTSRLPITPNQLWLGLFALWLIFLSGLLSPLLKTPGILQALRLNSILDAKQEQINRSENELLALQNDAELLEKNHIVQQREIRKVLGYAAPDELIFDFSSEQTVH
jgi:cell division protein FtsB